MNSIGIQYKIYQILSIMILYGISLEAYSSGYKKEAIDLKVNHTIPSKVHCDPWYPLSNEPQNLRHRNPIAHKFLREEDNFINSVQQRSLEASLESKTIYPISDLINIDLPEEKLKSSLEYYELVGEMEEVKEFTHTQASKEIPEAYYLLAFINERELEDENKIFKEREIAFNQAVHWYTKAYNHWTKQQNFEKAEKANNALKGVIENFSQEQQNIKTFKENTLKWFSAKKQNIVIDRSTPFFQGIYDLDEKIEILRAVGRIPLRDQASVLEKVSPFLGDIKEGRGRAVLIRAISSIPVRNIEIVLEKAAFFLQGIKDGKGRANIIRAIGKISDPQDSLFEVLPSFLIDIKDGTERAAVIRALGSIPSHDLKKYIEILRPLLVDIKEGKNKVSIIKTVSTVPVQKLKILIEKAIPFLKTTDREERKVEFIKAIKRGLVQVPY